MNSRGLQRCGLFSLVKIFFLLAFAYSPSVYGTEAAPQIIGDSIINLKEGWEFHFKEFLTPGDEPSGSGFEIIRLPYAWNSTGRPAKGFASFRKVVKLNTQKSWALKLEFIHTAYRLYIDGEEKAVRGDPSVDPKRHLAGFRPALIFFTPKGQETEILLHVSNANHENGGILTDILIGPADLMEARQRQSGFIDVFLLGTVVIMSLYHFSLFYTRREDKSSLYFALFCLFILMRIGFAGEKSIAMLLPWLPDPLIAKFEFLSIYTGVPVFVLFARSLYKKYIPKLLVQATLSVGAVYTIITIAAPNHIYANLMFEKIYYFFSVLCFVLVLRAFAKAARDREPGAAQGFAGFVIFFFFMLNDLFHDLGFIETGYYIPVGFYFFIFSQAYNLAVRFSQAFKEQEKYISLQKDIEVAKGIQRTLLPEARPQLPSLTSFIWYRAAQQISGDFYDYWVNDSGDFLRLLVADVSGHGVPAAMLATMGKLVFNIESKRNESAADVLKGMNERLLGQMGTNFMTAQCIDFDLKLARVSVASGGHNMAYRLKRDNGELLKIPQKGRLLGQFPSNSHQLWTDDLTAGDRFMIVTDGLLEVATGTQVEEIESLLLEWLYDTRNLDLERAGNRLIENFISNFPNAPADDQTLVLLENTG